ncbi:MAG: hypothetical protein RMK32_00725 [Anaerolineae bacterium]|nr:hypothetical protein [Thermoflexus sp.]MDW8064139.1 hypothetical protein [Anaerolineae bacterium]
MSEWGIYEFGSNTDEVEFLNDGDSQVLRVDNALSDGWEGEDRAGFVAYSLLVPNTYNEWALEVRLRFPERTGFGMLFSAGTGSPSGCSGGEYLESVENVLRIHSNSDGTQVVPFDGSGVSVDVSAIAADFFVVRLEVYAGGTWNLLVNRNFQGSGTVPSNRALGGLHIGNYRYGCKEQGNWTSIHVDYVRIYGRRIFTPTFTPTPTPTPTSTSTSTPTPTFTPTATSTPTMTPTPTPSWTPSPTPTPTATPMPIETATPTPMPTPTHTSTATSVPAPVPQPPTTPTILPSASPTSTSTPIPTPTPTRLQLSPTPVVTLTRSPTETPMLAQMHVPTLMPTPTLPSIPQPSSRAPSIRGIVFLDRNGNGRLDHGEPGIAGAILEVEGKRISTGPDGHFWLPMGTRARLFSLPVNGRLTVADGVHFGVQPLRHRWWLLGMVAGFILLAVSWVWDPRPSALRASIRNLNIRNGGMG